MLTFPSPNFRPRLRIENCSSELVRVAHRRSPRGFVRRLIMTDAFHDFELAEIVCRTNVMQYVPQLEAEFGEGVTVGDLNIELGEVTVDSLGRGSTQTLVFCPNTGDTTPVMLCPKCKTKACLPRKRGQYIT